MRPDVRETLHRAAATPEVPLDLADLWARGRRHARHRRLAALAAPLTVLATDRWRRLPDPGLDVFVPTVAWTGTEVVAVVHDGTVAAYDPLRDAWRTLPAAGIHGGCGRGTAVVSGRVYVGRCASTPYDDALGVIGYDPTA